jgi:5-methylcytosine-specific restriction enzyme subunit McrC
MSNQLQLVESQEGRLELSGQEVARLESLSRELASSKSWWGSEDSDDDIERNVIGISSRGKGRYAVTVRNAVGAISLGNRTVVVAPKIPIDHFSYIASFALSKDNRTLDDPLRLSEGADFHDLIAGWLIENVLALLFSGLSMDYQEEFSELKFVRGKIDIPRTSLALMRGSLTVQCSFENRTFNSPENRIIKSALDCINSASPGLQRSNADLLRLRNAFRDVEPAGFSDLLMPERAFPLRYRTTVDLAISIIGYTGLALEQGARSAKSFLVRTPGLIEQGIRRIVEIGLSPVSVAEGGKTLVPTTLRVKPDLVLARPPFTADVKYKKFGSTWNRGDLAQGVFFAESYRSPIAAVIGFSNGAIALPVVPVGGITVSPVAWDIGHGQRPRESAEKMLTALRLWLPESERLVEPAHLR